MKTLKLLIVLLVMNLTALSQINSVSLGIGISDSVKKEVAVALTEGNKCLEKQVVYRSEIVNLTFQVGKQAERISTLMLSNKNLTGQKSVLQQEIVIYDERIDLKDKQIIQLKTTRWIIIGISGAAVVATIVVASQLR